MYDNIKNNKFIYSIIFSLCSIYSLKYMIKSDNGLIISNSMLSIILLISFIVFFKYIIINCEKNLFIHSYPLGVIFSILMIFGNRLAVYDSINLDGGIFNKVLFVAGIFCGSILFTGIIICILNSFNKLDKLLIRIKINSNIVKILEPNIKNFFIIWIAILIFWFPIFLASYPGSYAYDAIYQVNQLRVEGQLNNHHPIIHTLYLYGCIMAGNKAFGNYESGMAIYSITQMITMSGIFAYTWFYLSKRKVHIIFQIIVILFYTLFPIHSLLAINATKDIIFAGIMLLFFIFTIDLLKEKEIFFKSLKLQIRYILTICLMILFRNNGIHIFVFCIPFLIFAVTNNRIRMGIICAIVMIFYSVYTGPIFNMLNVKQSDFRETLSAPIQMLARAVKDNEDYMSDEELDSIYKIIPKDTAELYNSRLSDPVKNKFNTTEFKSNKLYYCKLWMSIGLKYPKSYINGFLSTNLGFWYPDVDYPDKIANRAYIEYNMREKDGDYLILKRHSLIPMLEKYCSLISYKTIHQNVPILSMLFNSGFYFWLLLLCILIIIYIKKYLMIIPCMIYIGLWGTLILSPIVNIRYGYPLMISIPILFVLILNEYVNSKKEKR